MTNASLPQRAAGRSRKTGALRVIQWNTQHSPASFNLLQRFLDDHNHDVLLIQDPPRSIALGKNPLRDFSLFLPPKGNTVGEQNSDDPLVAIFEGTSTCAIQISFSHNCMCGIKVSTHKGPLAMICTYIRFTHGIGIDDLSQLVNITRS